MSNREESGWGKESPRPQWKVSLDEEQVRTFVRHLCKEALALYDRNKIAATNDLVDKARRKAGIEPDEIQPLLEALVNQWQE